MRRWVEDLQGLSACDEAIRWAEKQNCSLREAWHRCSEPGWLLWLARTLTFGDLIGAVAEETGIERSELLDHLYTYVATDKRNGKRLCIAIREVLPVPTPADLKAGVMVFTDYEAKPWVLTDHAYSILNPEEPTDRDPV